MKFVRSFVVSLYEDVKEKKSWNTGYREVVEKQIKRIRFMEQEE